MDKQIDLAAEKRVVRNVLTRVFNQHMATSLMRGFYPPNITAPQFVGELCGGPPPEMDAALVAKLGTSSACNTLLSAVGGSQNASKGCMFRFRVHGFANSHFAKDVFPTFSVTLEPSSGLPLNKADALTKALLGMKIRLAVHNKWADVSEEVLEAELTRTLENGKLKITDLVFLDVTLKHGGYFVLRISSPDFQDIVEDWKSDKFVIQSVKTHCNKKRKLASSNANNLRSLDNEPPSPIHSSLPPHPSIDNNNNNNNMSHSIHPTEYSDLDTFPHNEHSLTHQICSSDMFDSNPLALSMSHNCPASAASSSPTRPAYSSTSSSDFLPRYNLDTSASLPTLPHGLNGSVCVPPPRTGYSSNYL